MKKEIKELKNIISDLQSRLLFKEAKSLDEAIEVMNMLDIKDNCEHWVKKEAAFLELYRMKKSSSVKTADECWKEVINEFRGKDLKSDRWNRKHAAAVGGASGGDSMSKVEREFYDEIDKGKGTPGAKALKALEKRKWGKFKEHDPANIYGRAACACADIIAIGKKTNNNKIFNIASKILEAAEQKIESTHFATIENLLGNSYSKITSIIEAQPTILRETSQALALLWNLSRNIINSNEVDDDLKQTATKVFNDIGFGQSKDDATVTANETFKQMMRGLDLGSGPVPPTPKNIASLIENVSTNFKIIKDQFKSFITKNPDAAKKIAEGLSGATKFDPKEINKDRGSWAYEPSGAQKGTESKSTSMEPEITPAESPIEKFVNPQHARDEFEKLQTEVYDILGSIDVSKFKKEILSEFNKIHNEHLRSIQDNDIKSQATLFAKDFAKNALPFLDESINQIEKEVKRLNNSMAITRGHLSEMSRKSSGNRVIKIANYNPEYERSLQNVIDKIKIFNEKSKDNSAYEKINLRIEDSVKSLENIKVLFRSSHQEFSERFIKPFTGIDADKYTEILNAKNQELKDAQEQASKEEKVHTWRKDNEKDPLWRGYFAYDDMLKMHPLDAVQNTLDELASTMSSELRSEIANIAKQDYSIEDLNQAAQSFNANIITSKDLVGGIKNASIMLGVLNSIRQILPDLFRQYKQYEGGSEEKINFSNYLSSMLKNIFKPELVGSIKKSLSHIQENYPAATERRKTKNQSQPQTPKTDPSQVGEPEISVEEPSQRQVAWNKRNRKIAADYDGTSYLDAPSTTWKEMDAQLRGKVKNIPNASNYISENEINQVSKRILSILSQINDPAEGTEEERNRKIREVRNVLGKEWDESNISMNAAEILDILSRPNPSHHIRKMNDPDTIYDNVTNKFKNKIRSVPNASDYISKDKFVSISRSMSDILFQKGHSEEEISKKLTNINNILDQEWNEGNIGMQLATLESYLYESSPSSVRAYNKSIAKKNAKVQ